MPNTETKWVKFGNIKAIALLGKEVIAMASGIHVIFINLNTKDERVERFDNKDRGDGACCLTGHPVVPMFAVAERCLNPRITVFTYPEIIKVSSCVYKKSRRLCGYLSSTFAGTEYLITLTSFPDFQLIVWLWKTGENLKVINTKIQDDTQLITCSPSSPFFLTQMGESTGEIKLYEMTVCSKIISLIPTSNFMTTARIVSSSWTYDGNLLLCDDLGNVSLFYIDAKRHYFIVNSSIQSAPNWRSLVVDFRTGAAVINNLSEMIFYRKSPSNRTKFGGEWKSIWQVETPSHPIFIIRHPQRDSLLFCTSRGEIVEVSVGDDDVPRMQIICHQGSGYLFLLPINPTRQYIGIIDNFNQLIILESHTGDLLSAMLLNNFGKILQAVAHNILPLIVIVTETGKCNIINVVDVANPVLIKSIYLIEKPLNKMKFSMNGNILGAANANDGDLFIVSGFRTIELNALTVVNVPTQIVDFLIFENKNSILAILVLIKAHPTIFIGNQLIVYIVNEQTLETDIDRVIQLPMVFKTLHYGSNSWDILASPYLTKQLHLIKKNGNQTDKDCGLSLVVAISVPHQLRDVNINSDSYLVLTYGYDGLVTLRNKTNIQTTICRFVSHHRMECGVKFAVICQAHNVVVSLGENGNLISTRLSQLNNIENGVSDLIDCSVDFSQALQLLNKLTPVKNKRDNMTWIELKNKERLKKECEAAAGERAIILKDFYDLKMQLKELLDANEKETGDMKLSMETFDLDIETRSEKIRMNTVNNEALIRELEEQINHDEELTAYLRETYWNTLRVPPCTLISLDGKICVNNYPLAVEGIQGEENHEDWINFPVDMPTKQFGIEQPKVQSSKFSKLDDIKKFKVNVDDVEEQLAMCGTTSHRWIPEKTKKIFNQIDARDNDFDMNQMIAQAKETEKKLKEYFNSLFDETRKFKEETIKLANKQIERVKHCQNDLKQIFGVEMSVSFDDLNLNWHDSEKPESIIKVEDWEVHERLNNSMGISAHCVDVTAGKNEEENSADFFYEEALEKMMNGVLEVKWEDEIKKDIEKPDCLAKNIENCTEDELEIIKKYEVSVKNLEIARSNYKSTLEKEIVEVQDALRKSASNFNSKLKELHLERIKIESAILQEKLMCLCQFRRRQVHQQSMVEIQRIETVELNPAIAEVKKFTEELATFEVIVNETRTRYESLLKRDKMLEGKFRGEFPDLKQPMVEHLLRHYKKRPQISHWTCTSVTYLTEMSKCIISGEKSVILPYECVDFLKGIQNLDIMPSNLPSQIDSNHWFNLCRVRRAKVEIETRLKSCAVELAEAEQTLSSHQKIISNSQNRIHQLCESIDEFKRRDYETLRNIDVQLVLKMGQIEVQLSGHPSELSEAVLVSFDKVLEVNDVIVKAGRHKIAAMNKTIAFRKTIEWQEWHHRYLKLKLHDLKEDLEDLQSVKVTKEIQKYLMSHSHVAGQPQETEKWETNLISMKKRHTAMIHTETQKLNEIEQKIDEWKRKNVRIDNAIDKLKLENLKLSLQVNDEEYVQNKKFRETKLKMIMRRNRLMKRIQDNYENLLTLRSELEALRLKTYPTLRLKELRVDNN